MGNEIFSVEQGHKFGVGVTHLMIPTGLIYLKTVRQHDDPRESRQVVVGSTSWV